MGGCNLTEQQFSDIMQRGNVLTHVARYSGNYLQRILYYLLDDLYSDSNWLLIEKEQFIKFISVYINQKSSCFTAIGRVSNRACNNTQVY